MNIDVLYVDDEEQLAANVAEYFNMFDINTNYVTSVAACYDFFKENTADVLLLDINLGDGNGFEVCKKIRNDFDIPIIFISARGSDDDILTALNIGGDDYIKKPFSLSVLLAKVKATLKRVNMIKEAKMLANESAKELEDSNNENKLIVLEDATMSVIVKGNKFTLKAKEYALLKCLYNHKNTIVTKEQLFDEVWGDEYYGDGTLNVHIRKIREKIEDNPNEPEFIKTIWGTGYILNC